MMDLREAVEEALHRIWLRRNDWYEAAARQEQHGDISGQTAICDARGKEAGMCGDILGMALSTVTPRAGYDVYCAQDAPAFEHWERVAWFADVLNFTEFIATYETEHFSSANFWEIISDNQRSFDIHEYEGDFDSDHGIVRRYHILPAGSPPPGNEVSE